MTEQQTTDRDLSTVRDRTDDEATGTSVPVEEAASGAQAPEDSGDDQDATGERDASESGADDAETFPRAVVEKLRRENAGYRARAIDRDAIARRLHTALVTATGRLVDPSDLPYDEDHLTDQSVLIAAIDALVQAKPHLGDRRPRGDIGQGARGQDGDVNLAGILRGLAS